MNSEEKFIERCGSCENFGRAFCTTLKKHYTEISYCDKRRDAFRAMLKKVVNRLKEEGRLTEAKDGVICHAEIVGGGRIWECMIQKKS